MPLKKAAGRARDVIPKEFWVDRRAAWAALSDDERANFEAMAKGDKAEKKVQWVELTEAARAGATLALADSVDTGARGGHVGVG